MTQESKSSRFIFCPKCGIALVKSAQSCHSCGYTWKSQELVAPGKVKIQGSSETDTKDSEISGYCPICGLKLSPGSQTCPNCGYVVN